MSSSIWNGGVTSLGGKNILQFMTLNFFLKARKVTMDSFIIRFYFEGRLGYNLTVFIYFLK